MKRLLSTIFLTLLVIPSVGVSKIGEEYRSNIIDNNGNVIGGLKITSASGGVLIEIIARGLPSGKHGLHFHKNGVCDHKQSFKNAKGHIIINDKPHGFLNPKGPHEGNLPNLIVHHDGMAHVELYSNLVSFYKGNSPLLDKDGSALIIHKNRDDHISQPIGGAGSRIACSVIRIK